MSPFHMIEPFLSSRLSPFFLIGLPFGFGIGLDRLTLTSQQVFPCFDQRFGSSAQLCRLFVHVIETLIASLTNIFPRLFSRAGRQQQSGNSPQSYAEYE
jgi:hypothetical protein